MTKEIVSIAIREMPPEFDLDELFERLVFIEEMEAARKEIKEGRGIPIEEVKEIVKGWRK